MRRKKRKRTGISLRFLFVSLFTAATAFAHGQQSAPEIPQAPADNSTSRVISTRSIEGRVLNTSGTAVPGATVLLKDGKTLQVRSYIAQSDGQYHFYGLSTDVNYTLRASHNGMTSKQKTVSVFDSHKRVKLDLKLNKKIQPPKK